MNRKKIAAITTVISGKKNYIVPQMSTRSFDNKKVVQYTQVPEEAKEFVTLKAAQEFIPRIANPHDRIFTAEEVEVDVVKLKQREPVAEELS